MRLSNREGERYHCEERSWSCKWTTVQHLPEKEDDPGQWGEKAGVVAFQPRGVGLKSPGLFNRVTVTLRAWCANVQ
jgi:hypothetical protein